MPTQKALQKFQNFYFLILFQSVQHGSKAFIIDYVYESNLCNYIFLKISNTYVETRSYVVE